MLRAKKTSLIFSFDSFERHFGFGAHGQTEGSGDRQTGFQTDRFTTQSPLG